MLFGIGRKDKPIEKQLKSEFKCKFIKQICSPSIGLGSFVFQDGTVAYLQHGECQIYATSGTSRELTHTLVKGDVSLLTCDGNILYQQKIPASNRALFFDGKLYFELPDSGEVIGYYADNGMLVSIKESSSSLRSIWNNNIRSFAGKLALKATQLSKTFQEDLFIGSGALYNSQAVKITDLSFEMINPYEQKSFFRIKSNNTIQKVFLRKKGDEYSIHEQEFKFPYAISSGPKTLLFEKYIGFHPNGLFVFAAYTNEKVTKTGKAPHQRVNSEYSSYIAVFETDKLNLIGTFKIDGTSQSKVSGIDTISVSGNKFIVCQHSYNLYIYEINFDELSALASNAIESKNQVSEAIGLITRIQLPSVTPVNPLTTRESNEQSRQQKDTLAAKKKIHELSEPLFTKVTSIEQLKQFEAVLDELRKNKLLAQHPEAFIEIDSRRTILRDNLQVKELEEKIRTYTVLFESGINENTAQFFHEEFLQIQQMRLSVNIADIKIRERIDQCIDNMAPWRAEVWSVFEEEIEGKLGANLVEISNKLSKAKSLNEVVMVHTDPIAKWFKNSCVLFEDKARRDHFKGQYEQIFVKRIEEINLEQAKLVQVHEEILADKAQVANELIDQMTGVLSTTQDYGQINAMRDSHPLITLFREQILTFPNELRKAAEQKMNSVFDSHLHRTRIKNEIVLTNNNSQVTFGTETFDLFSDYSLLAKSEIVLDKDRPGSYKLIYKDSIGRVFDTGRTLLTDDDSDSEVIKALNETRAQAHRYFQNLPRQVPTLREDWVLTPSIVANLDEIARKFKNQLKAQDGIFILEGEAGTGKNVLLELFCHFTNRELLTLACNRYTEKEDLTYAFRFNKERGTYQVDSSLVEKIQTPGAVIVFDEINTLPPSVLKMLNALFDSRRALYLSDGRIIKADPSVIFVGAMNPRHYKGVEPLSQEVISRARIHTIDYPPLTVNINDESKYTPDEILLVSRSVEEFDSLSMQEIAALFEEEINDAPKSANFDPIQRLQMRNLHTVIKTANVVRTAYKNYMSELSTEEITFVFSVREVKSIATELTPGTNVKEIIKDVVLPKISDRSERLNIELLIEQS